MENKIVLSGDIIASTSLNNEEKLVLERELKHLLTILDKKFSVYGRIIKGDYLEMVVEKPEDALGITLLIKSYIKSIQLNEISSDKRYKNFKNHGIRIAMGFGKLNRFDKENGIIDGDAIYFSGRKISEESTTYNKERIVIKNTLFFVSDNESLNQNVNTQLGLIDVLLTNGTSKQCKVLFYRLLGMSEIEIANELKIKQPTVNKQLTSIGWNAIEKSVTHFSSIIKNY